MKTPAAVFGSSGFIGGAIVRERSLNDLLAVQGFSSKDADLTDWDQVSALAARLEPASVWVVAAARSPDWPGPPMDGMLANINMAKNLAALIERAPPRYAIYLSSVDVYGRENLILPLKEASPIRPSSYYAVSKHASEQILAVACRKAGIPLTILRLPSVYGPGDAHWGPVRSLVAAAVRHEQITIEGNGEQRRDLLFVRDVPRIVKALCAAPAPGTFNAVTGRSPSLNEMLRLIEEVSGEKPDVAYNCDAPQIDLVFEAPIILRQLPSVTLTSLERGIRETYTFMKHQLATGSGP